jgi:hypothetical protein
VTLCQAGAPRRRQDNRIAALVRLGSERLVGKTGSRALLVGFMVLLVLAALVVLRVAYALSG